MLLLFDGERNLVRAESMGAMEVMDGYGLFFALFFFSFSLFSPWLGLRHLDRVGGCLVPAAVCGMCVYSRIRMSEFA